jgi:hypothetical protein
MPSISNAVMNLIIVRSPLLRQARHPLRAPRHVTMPAAALLTNVTQRHTLSRLLESWTLHRTTRAAGIGD